jgi:hypothetical protein
MTQCAGMPFGSYRQGAGIRTLGSTHRFTSKQSISSQPEQALTQLRTQSPGITCPELARVVAAWEKLPEHVQ